MPSAGVIICIVVIKVMSCFNAGIFEDDEVTHVEGDVNPVRDMEIIHEELRLKDLEYLDKNVDHLERVAIRGSDKSRKGEYVSFYIGSAASSFFVD